MFLFIRMSLIEVKKIKTLCPQLSGLPCRENIGGCSDLAHSLSACDTHREAMDGRRERARAMPEQPETLLEQFPQDQLFLVPLRKSSS